jgi:glutaredoxin
MLTLYSLADCSDCHSIEQALGAMAIAHKVVRIATHEETGAVLPGGAELPALVDDGRLYCGLTEITKHIEWLRQFKAEWDKFQSDACYCDDDGQVI